ncbi:MAG: hypothetical protein GC168_21775 [Candidatus Hydrogenedens sp.]|nr:hypothetical protein [Candidatus Hydrogenedens sp.]
MSLDTETDRRWTRMHTITLVFVLLVAAFTRTSQILAESPWNDEVLTLKYIGLPTQAEYLKAVFEEDPWLILSQGYYRVQYACRYLFGGSVIAIRMLSVVLSLASLPLIAWLGHRLFSPSAGVAAAAFSALALVQVYYAQETRFYALLNLEALVAVAGLVWALQRGSRWGWLWHFVGNAALLYTHAFTPLFFAAQGLFLLWYWRGRPVRVLVWGAAHFAMLGLFFLWVLYGLHYDFADKTQAYNDIPPTWREWVMTYIVFAGGRFSNHEPSPYMWGGISLDWGVTVLMLGLAAFAVSRFAAKSDGDGGWNRRDSLVLLLAWVVVPVALLFAASIFWRPVYQYRYVLYANAALMLLAGGGWSLVDAKRVRIGIAVLLLSLMAWQNFALTRPFRPCFGLLWGIARENPPSAGILAMKPFVGRAAQFAVGDVMEVGVLYGIDDMIFETDKRLRDGGELLILFHQWNDYDRLEAAFDQRGYRYWRWELPGIPPLEMYQIWGPSE